MRAQARQNGAAMLLGIVTRFSQLDVSYEALETGKGPKRQTGRSFHCKISGHGEQDGNI